MAGKEEGQGNTDAGKVVARVQKEENKNGQKINGAKVLILGVTFKENCSDIRNSRVVDIYLELKQFGLEVAVFDPHADKKEVAQEYSIELVDRIDCQYDAIILAVSHNEFLNIDLPSIRNGKQSVVFDTKSFLDRSLVDARL